MELVRVGIVGVGNIGSFHTKYLYAGEIKGAKLTGVCDIDPKRLEWAKANTNNSVETFDNYDALLDSGLIDAVIISVPHYYHPPYAIEAFKHGINVMVEKPGGVYTKQVKEMHEAAAKSSLSFGIMFNRRVRAIYQKISDLIHSGELGDLRRVNYIVSDEYRTQAYHDSGPWRSTWSGEGGGYLLNQGVHSLDLWQMMCGLPVRVRGFCYNGKYRNIETEDEVTIYAEYENGATGVFIGSTTEYPGTNRLEIVGSRGKILVENEGRIRFWRARQDEKDFNATSTIGFAHPETWMCEIPVERSTAPGEYEMAHPKIFQNFVNNILYGEKLIVPGEAGRNVVQLINAIYLSSWTDEWVSIPVDEDLYYNKLQETIKNSTFKKPKVVEQIHEDMSSTF